MERDQHAVGGDADVGLHVPVAEREGALEGRHGVLRTLPRAAPMGEGDRAGMVEERVRQPRSIVQPWPSSPLPLAGERFTGSDSITVTRPTTGPSSAGCPRAPPATSTAPSPPPRPRSPRDRCRRGSAPRSSIRGRRLLAERREEFARIIAAEAAKPIKTARVEAERAVGTFQFAAAEARKLAGEMVPLDAAAPGEGKLGFTLRVPIGVVGAISPFNFPLNLVAHKVAPAIAAGCPVVLKPASQTPFSSISLAWLLIDECGLPAEQLHVVTGGGGTVGNALVDHPDIALITFTGSPAVGWAHPRPSAAQAGRSRARQQRAGHHRARRRLEGRGRQDQGRRLQPRRAELHLDAADLRAPLDRRRLHGRAGRGRPVSLVVGDPMDEATDVSALISPASGSASSSGIDEAKAARRQGGDRGRADP